MFEFRWTDKRGVPQSATESLLGTFNSLSGVVQLWGATQPAAGGTSAAPVWSRSTRGTLHQHSRRDAATMYTLSLDENWTVATCEYSNESGAESRCRLVALPVASDAVSHITLDGTPLRDRPVGFEGVAMQAHHSAAEAAIAGGNTMPESAASSSADRFCVWMPLRVSPHPQCATLEPRFSPVPRALIVLLLFSVGRSRPPCTMDERCAPCAGSHRQPHGSGSNTGPAGA